MKVLVIGSGGREHALAWKVAQSTTVEALYCAPGNPGTARLEKAENAPIDPVDFEGLRRLIEDKGIALTIVGPEAPLAAGIADALGKDGHAVFGPPAAAARLEASKSFAKAFMEEQGIPTAGYAEFEDADKASAYVQQRGAPVVIKADGLAAGKGVTVARSIEAAKEAIHQAMVEQAFGEAGSRVIVEDCLEGEEASILAFCDGRHVLPTMPSQDHKPVYDGDYGPNTGGMGAYSPAPVVTESVMERIMQDILQPAVQGMADRGTPYRGILYAGLMITAEGPKVIEFNVRFGDPETQAILPRMRSDIVPVIQACCDGALGGHTIDYDERPCVTVVMASGGYPQAYEKGKVITGIAEAEADPNVLVFHAGTREEDGRVLTSGGRVLNVTALGDDLPAAIEHAYGAVQHIHFDKAHYRSDIGQKAIKALG